MKNVAFLFCMLFMMGFQSDRKTFSRLYALQGTWQREKGKAILFESWQKQNDHQLNGRSYTISGMDTTFVENMVLSYKEKQVVFTAVDIQGKEHVPTAFTLSAIERNSFFFVNPDHDFPKRIVYDLVSKDSLHAWIDGGENAPDNRVDFYFKRIQ